MILRLENESSLVEVHRYFEAIYYIHLHDGRLTQATIKAVWLTRVCASPTHNPIIMNNIETILNTALLKSSIFWDITPCSPSKITDVLCSAYHLHSRWFLPRHIFRPWRLRRYVPAKHRLTFNGLHRVIDWLLIYDWITYIVSRRTHRKHICFPAMDICEQHRKQPFLYCCIHNALHSNAS
jgi:hypothetical protein